MKMPSMFTKLAGAVATSVILAGAPGAATAQNTNEPQRQSVEDYEAKFKRLGDSNSHQINARLKKLNLPEIEIGEPVMIMKCPGIQFGVYLKKDKTHLFDESCGNRTFENRYEFEEKFLGKIISQVEQSSQQTQNLNPANTIEGSQLYSFSGISIALQSSAINFMKANKISLKEVDLAGKKNICFMQGDRRISLDCIDSNTKNVSISFVNNLLKLDIVNKDGSREKYRGKISTNNRDIYPIAFEEDK